MMEQLHSQPAWSSWIISACGVPFIISLSPFSVILNNGFSKVQVSHLSISLSIVCLSRRTTLLDFLSLSTNISPSLEVVPVLQDVVISNTVSLSTPEVVKSYFERVFETSIHSSIDSLSRQVLSFLMRSPRCRFFTRYSPLSAFNIQHTKLSLGPKTKPLWMSLPSVDAKSSLEQHYFLLLWSVAFRKTHASIPISYDFVSQQLLKTVSKSKLFLTRCRQSLPRLFNRTSQPNCAFLFSQDTSSSSMSPNVYSVLPSHQPVSTFPF